MWRLSLKLRFGCSGGKLVLPYQKQKEAGKSRTVSDREAQDKESNFQSCSSFHGGKSRLGKEQTYRDCCCGGNCFRYASRGTEFLGCRNGEISNWSIKLVPVGRETSMGLGVVLLVLEVDVTTEVEWTSDIEVVTLVLRTVFVVVSVWVDLSTEVDVLVERTVLVVVTVTEHRPFVSTRPCVL
jgi:hypothetical protein